MTSHVSSPAQARRRLGPQLAVRLQSREEEMQSRREIEISPQLTPRGPQTGEWSGALTQQLGTGEGWRRRASSARGALATAGLTVVGWPVGRAHAARVGA